MLIMGSGKALWKRSLALLKLSKKKKEEAKKIKEKEKENKSNNMSRVYSKIVEMSKKAKEISENPYSGEIENKELINLTNQLTPEIEKETRKTVRGGGHR